MAVSYVLDVVRAVWNFVTVMRLLQIHVNFLYLGIHFLMQSFSTFLFRRF